MQYYTTAVILLFLSPSFWQQRNSENGTDVKGSPKDLSISCTVDVNTRTANVTFINRSSRTVYIQDQVNPRANYRVIITDSEGRRLKEAPLPALPPGIERPVWTSIRPKTFDPGERRTENVPLSALVQIPQEGGKFRIKIGRGLFVKWNVPWEFDPSQILWCKPIEVSLPPAK